MAATSPSVSTVLVCIIFLPVIGTAAHPTLERLADVARGAAENRPAAIMLRNLRRSSTHQTALARPVILQESAMVGCAGRWYRQR